MRKGARMSIRELVFGVLPEPLNLAYWFLVYETIDPRNWFIATELHSLEFYDLA
jgi:hypothetical protein